MEGYMTAKGRHTITIFYKILFPQLGKRYIGVYNFNICIWKFINLKIKSYFP